MQSRCQTSTWLTTYRSSLCIRARPCHLTFPFSQILPTLLATRYWFFILLSIPLLLIEFTPDYQCFKEASPPLTVLPGSSHPQRGHTRSLPSISSSCIYLREKTWKLTIRTKTKSSNGESEAVSLLQISKRLTTEMFNDELFMIFRCWNMSSTHLYYILKELVIQSNLIYNYISMDCGPWSLPQSSSSKNNIWFV